MSKSSTITSVRTPERITTHPGRRILRDVVGKLEWDESYDYKKERSR